MPPRVSESKHSLPQLFCKDCGTLLQERTTETDFTCPACGQTFPPTPEDSLVYEMERTRTTASSTMLRNAWHDPACTKVLTKGCPQCAHKMARETRIGKNMVLVYACMNADCLHVYDKASVS